MALECACQMMLRTGDRGRTEPYWKQRKCIGEAFKYQGFGGGFLGLLRDVSGGSPSGSTFEVAYVAVMFKGNVKFAAAGTDKENKPGGGEEGRAKELVKMRKRYLVSRFIVSPIGRKTFANKGNPTRYTLFHRAGPDACSEGSFRSIICLVSDSTRAMGVGCILRLSECRDFLRLQISLIEHRP